MAAGANVKRVQNEYRVKSLILKFELKTVLTNQVLVKSTDRNFSTGKSSTSKAFRYRISIIIDY